MNLDNRLTKLQTVLRRMSSLKFNAIWIALVLICFLAVKSGYCVEISWSEGFSFSRCANENEPINSADG